MSDRKLRVLLGICGGIAAYKMPGLIRLLIKNGCEVRVVLTRAAQNLVAKESLAVVSNHQVYTDETTQSYDMHHISLSKWADVYCICPATANTIAKIAHGIGDNLVTTLALSCQCQILIAPAMNPEMWHNSATVENCSILAKRSIHLLPVGRGEMACGDTGEGRLLAIETLVECILFHHAPQSFVGKRILISSGATVENIDPVRVISNRSSGRMGSALAQAALCMGGKVRVVTGTATASLPDSIERVSVESAEEMYAALHKHFDDSDICIMAAAISDFTPVEQKNIKIKRTETGLFSIELKPTLDISESLSQRKGNRTLVCFALEGEEDHALANAKMQKKGCDFLILNTVSSTLGKDTATVTIFSKTEPPQRFESLTKREAGREICMAIAKQYSIL